jgi:hypothetical protein
LVARHVAKEAGLSDFRVVVNDGASAGLGETTDRSSV